MPATAVERWGVFTLSLTGPPDSPSKNAFEIAINATFALAGSRSNFTVLGFYDSSSTYRIRFSPPQEGTWHYVTHSSEEALAGHVGEFAATPASLSNHGPVESRGFELVHADGTPHLSVGTTCYQWSSMDPSMQKQTLATLSASPFNKIRMTVFPKWYPYNHQNPVQAGAPFAIKPGSVAANATAWECVGTGCPSLAQSFDLHRPNVSYWRNYEALVKALGRMDIVADIILFHPYDRGHWGFDCMGGRDRDEYDTSLDEAYLRYAAARLSAYSNVWWSMANEWSQCHCKSKGVNASHLISPSPTWDRLFTELVKADPHGRQASIHNGQLLYNHSRPWITHVSLQVSPLHLPLPSPLHPPSPLLTRVRASSSRPRAFAASLASQ